MRPIRLIGEKGVSKHGRNEGKRRRGNDYDWQHSMNYARGKRRKKSEMVKEKVAGH